MTFLFFPLGGRLSFMYNSIIGKDPNDLTFVIDGKEIIIESAKFTKTMDVCADTFSGIMPWEPGNDKIIDDLTKPFKYKNCGVYLGGELQSAMVLYDISHRTNAQGTVKEFEAYSKTADLIDSTVVPPYEMNNVTLSDRAKQQCRPLGINVIIGDDAAKKMLSQRRIVTMVERPVVFTLSLNIFNGPIFADVKLDQVEKSSYVTDEKRFGRVSAKPTETIFKHLSDLARQRGLLLAATKIGDLLITRANDKSIPIGTIIEAPIGPASSLGMEYSAKFSGRDRFSTYRALVKTPQHGRTKYQYMTSDPIVKIPRLLTFDADDNIPGDALNAAVWRKNKAAADAMTINFPVSSWYGPDKKLWEPNTIVTVMSKTLNIDWGFEFLITRVEFIFDNQGCRAVLQFKPPTAYSTGEIKEPWT